MDDQHNPNWLNLRSDIYIRDKGMCWICNTFVNLDEYDLGHIIDRTNGGHDDYDNLAVMHRTCNHSKPPHQTLEEALKWKLTAFMPAIQQARGMASQKPNPSYHYKRRLPRNPDIIYTAKPITTLRQQAQYDEQIAKIKPATLCWIQGRPKGGAMWYVLPPPYRQEDMFVMRQTPPNAIDNGKKGIIETTQVICGTLTQDIDISVGILQIYVSNQDGTLVVRHKPNTRGNNGQRSQTIGMGQGQIPLPDWYKAKTQGISLGNFRANYHDLK